jgi:hypothetical protein
MRTYLIFDCTVLASPADRTLFGPARAARALAAWRSFVTGRLHDFSAVVR